MHSKYSLLTNFGALREEGRREDREGAIRLADGDGATPRVPHCVENAASGIVAADLCAVAGPEDVEGHVVGTTREELPAGAETNSKDRLCVFVDDIETATAFYIPYSDRAVERTASEPWWAFAGDPFDSVHLICVSTEDNSRGWVLVEWTPHSHGLIIGAARKVPFARVPADLIDIFCVSLKKHQRL